jgi:proteasome-associated ATPase
MGLAFEKIESCKGEEYFLEATPSDSFDEIGGLDREIEALKRLLTLHMFHAETAGRYKLQRKKAVLMEGPPGNGKTKVARAACAWLASLSQSGRSHFINVKPGALNSMWFGATEERYREIFRAAREAAAENPDVPVVMFWDEVDAIGGNRGESAHRIDDRMLNAFMAELNGLEERGNIMILAATNRLDSIDPALLRPGRLGDLVLHFPQPRGKAARAILSRHMPADIPYASNGEGPAVAREVLLDSAVAQIFTQNGETELANLTLRDGKRRLVRAADLVSGAQLEAMAQSAIERACVREAEGGPTGVTAADMNAAISDFFLAAPRALTPRNARNYLRDLPQDVDVVRVDLVERKVSHPHRYFRTVA